MRYTYVASDNSTSDAETLNVKGQDAFVKKVIFGTPGDGEIIRFYNQTVATGHTSGIGSVSDSGLACMITQPTAAAGKDWLRDYTFTSEFNPGLQLDGGSFHTDASQVTVIWDDK